MLFNTPQYLLFLLVILVMLWITNKWAGLLFRNTLLLVASYYFYANLHIGFVGLLVYITLVNYFGGIWIISEQKRGSSGKKAVAVSILLSLLVLIFFKYAYFFNDSILLPIGLSFFTFQALSYSIDIYRGKINPETSFINWHYLLHFSQHYFPVLSKGQGICYHNCERGYYLMKIIL
jgi:alginate O-acetyltransferase algI